MMNLMIPFQDFNTQFPAANSELSDRRKAAAEKFQKLGLPTKTNENWHYTSVKSLGELNFKLALLERGSSSSSELQKYLNKDFSQLVFVDGKFISEFSEFVEIKSFLSFSTEANQLESKDQAFELLNRSFAHQGLILNIPSNTVVEKPVQILSFVTAANVMTHPFCKISLGARSKLSLLETYAGVGAEYLQNSVSQIEVGESAKLEYLRLQNDHLSSYNFGSTQIVANKFSTIEAFSVSLGSKIGRHDLRVEMKGLGATASVNGITLGFREQHLDHLTLIDHQVGECTTSQLYKAVLGERARSVFTGKVIIQKGAQKASSEQLNNNLLLSRDAEADSRPQLEILADDVKATHGSTVGQLDAEELFYLVSRAIPKSEAIEMLSVGYLQELVFKVVDLKVRQYLNQILLEVYRQGVKS